MTPTPALQILFVCTGNICRSPLAAQLLDAELALRGGDSARGAAARVCSRGTQARVGEPMEDRSARQSRALGGDPVAHIARQLTSADLDAADLVVTMTLEQRAFAARLRPSASKKSVTLLEFTRLLEHGWNEEPGTGHERLALLLSRRSTVPPPRRDDTLIIPDPYGRSSAIHSRVARQIHSSVESLAGWLDAGSAGTPAADPSPRVTVSRRQLREQRGRLSPEGERALDSRSGQHAQ